MLADLLEAINFDLVWFFFWAGFVLIAAGTALIVVTRDQIVIGPDPQIPSVVEPGTVGLPRPPKSHAAREELPTARIPGATPVHPVAQPGPQEPLVGLRELPSGTALQRFLDAVDADLRATDEVTEKIGSDEEPTQVVDLCPLTTQDIQIAADVPDFEHSVRLSNQSTQDLRAAVERAKERAA